MNRTWLTSLLTTAVACSVIFAFARTMQAQSGGAPPSGVTAIVNVVYVFNEYQRQKDLTEEVNQLKAELEAEEVERRNKIDALQATIDAMDPNDPNYTQRMHELFQMQVEYRVWGEVKNADLKREIGLWTVRMYRELVAKVEEIAEQQGYDLVLYRGQFEQLSSEPEVIREQIRTNHVLYASGSIDITQTILESLNQEYRSQPQKKMLYVP